MRTSQGRLVIHGPYDSGDAVFLDTGISKTNFDNLSF